MAALRRCQYNYQLLIQKSIGFCIAFCDYRKLNDYTTFLRLDSNSRHLYRFRRRNSGLEPRLRLRPPSPQTTPMYPLLKVALATQRAAGRRFLAMLTLPSVQWLQPRWPTSARPAHGL